MAWVKNTLLVALMTGCIGPSDGAPLNSSITADELSVDLHFLSGDAMEGRMVGTPGIEKAAEFIASRFDSLGLEPAGEVGSFYQSFNLVRFSLAANNSFSVQDGTSSPVSGELGDHFYPLNFSGTGSAQGALMFAGFGMVDSQLGYDDYAQVPVEGKVVMVLEREPGVEELSSKFDGVVTSNASTGWRKALNAQHRGAVGILFVRDIHNRLVAEDFSLTSRNYWPGEERRIERFSLEKWTDQIHIPAVQVSVQMAERLVSRSGFTFQELAKASETSSGLGAIELPGIALSLNTAVDRHLVPARNILGLIRGNDPDLATEVVLITAHHDHNGSDGADVFNGADDDGSGTVALLEIAEAYTSASRDGVNPKRSVLFAAWDAEERGLLGAWQYAENPLVPLNDIVAVLNMDMIGRNEEVPLEDSPSGRFRGLSVQSSQSNSNAINILGHSYSVDMKNQVELANQNYGLDLKFRYDNNRSNLLRRSDHWPFLQVGVPALWFHTGLHPDYHTTNDIPELIEYEKMERIVRLVHQTSWQLANQSERPVFSLAQRGEFLLSQGP
ncbi:MAG: M28 family peptidase, partial [bacterium]